MVKRRFKPSDSPRIFDSPIISDKVSDRVSDKISDRVSDKISDRVSDKISDRVSDRVSDRIFDKKFDSPKFTWHTFKSLYRFYKMTSKVRKYLGIFDVKKPQVGLEPIIGNIYGSPPVDPRDCSVYPDSPYCGGFPIKDSFFSTSLSIVEDKCNLGIELSATLGYIKMPPVQIVHRNPECTLPPEKPKPPFEEYENPINMPPSCDRGGVMLYLNTYTLNYQDGQRKFYFEKPNGLTRTEVSQQLIKFDYSESEGSLNPLGEIDGEKYYFYVEWRVNGLYKSTLR